MLEVDLDFGKAICPRRVWRDATKAGHSKTVTAFHTTDVHKSLLNSERHFYWLLATQIVSNQWRFTKNYLTGNKKLLACKASRSFWTTKIHWEILRLSLHVCVPSTLLQLHMHSHTESLRDDISSRGDATGLFIAKCPLILWHVQQPLNFSQKYFRWAGM